MRKARAGGRGPRRVDGPGLPAWARRDATRTEEHGGTTVEVRPVQPYQATKPYACPGCHGTVAAGTGHLVVVPVAAPQDRRHWHRSCWEQRDRRGPR